MTEVLSSRIPPRGDQVDAPRTGDMLQGFYNNLIERHLLNADVSARFNVTEALRSGKPLQKLSQLSEMSANEFADEVARYFGLIRMGLADLMTAPSLADNFSQRFLRESSVFPCTVQSGHYCIVVADPTDSAAIRAAEIALGSDLEIAIASFEDIATVLAARLDDKASAPDADSAALARVDDDINRLRDLASGAPVVRAVNDLFERAMELRATDIHIEPFESGLVVRM